ncbi:MAG TPA: putative 2OG-Fe(II) oxygenase [Hyphomonadaceae bacterium]|nr:putative 2OG-Fe(II) oxygenase [Hyphomonadaceae bacterium]
MREAQELKAVGRLDEAIERYGEAVAANPKSGVAEHNLAAALGDAGRWAEAFPHIQAAFSKGIDAPETWLVKARGDLALGRLDASDRAFREAIRRRPGMYDAQRELAQLVWMRTGDAAAALKDVETALRVAPGDLRLAIVKAQTLEFAGKQDEAFALIAALSGANPGEAGLALQASQLAAALGRSAEALACAERARRVNPQDLATLITLTEALLSAGQPDRASEIAGNLRRRWSTNQHAMALQATAWRMLGDRRYRELYDYDAFVSSSLLDVPKGWTSLEAYVADVSAALNKLHAFKEHPFNQSLRHGSQAVDILQQPDPALKALRQALDGPIRRRLAALGRGDDPLRSRNTGDYKFQGMWSVRLRPSGYHVDHVHPQGWLSSACYIETVQANGREGWIKFGQPGVKTHPSLEPEHFVEPRPGLLVLFPSYMWHGTVPFSGEKPRLTFAFDIVPAEAPPEPDSEP